MNTILKKFYSLFIIAFLAFSLTSCFDLKEEVTINQDGSGSFIRTIDMGNNPMMQMVLNMQSDSAMNATKESGMNTMDSTMEKIKERLSTIQGISNIKTANSDEGMKYTIMYDFANIDALNAAVASDSESKQKKGDVKMTQKQYSYKKGQLIKNNSFSMGADDDKMDMSQILGGEEGSKTEEEKKQTQQMLEMFFGSSHYIHVVHVPNKVKSYSNKANTTLSEDGKTLTTTIPFLDLMKEGKKPDVGNKIKFK